VFVSSHLMGEMAVTADNLIVIGRGRLVANCSTEEFIDHSSHKSVLVKSADPDRLPAVLAGGPGGLRGESWGQLKNIGLNETRRLRSAVEADRASARREGKWSGRPGLDRAAQASTKSSR
jgi:ABC-2 type transport system ATP-binding protein